MNREKIYITFCKVIPTFILIILFVVFNGIIFYTLTNLVSSLLICDLGSFGPPYLISEQYI